jgi:lysophospholipase L1-like esterase
VAESRPARRIGASPGKLFVAAAVLVVVVTLVVSLWPRSPGPRVVIVGDSITVFAHHEITHALGGNYSVTISAVLGQRIDEMLPALQRDLATHPRAVVLNLGTNDVLQARLHPDWQTGFNTMISLVLRLPCVVLTTISTLATTSPAPDPAAEPQVASDINAAIVRTSASHRNVYVVDWNQTVHGPNGMSLLIPDRVHPSDAGSRVLATAIRHTLDDNCDGLRTARTHT